MPNSEQALSTENRDYAEVLRWNEDECCYYSEGVQLRSFSSPDPVRNWWVNKAIRWGVKNPLGDDLEGMLVDEETVRQSMIQRGVLDPDDERTVLKYG